MDGLIIKEKWLRLILSGLKSWEIRGSRTKKRGTIYLIQSGSSHIMGQVDIVDCIELTKERYEKNRGKHCIEAGWESLPLYSAFLTHGYLKIVCSTKSRYRISTHKGRLSG